MSTAGGDAWQRDGDHISLRISADVIVRPHGNLTEVPDIKLTPNDLIAMLQELDYGYRPPVGPKLHEAPLPEGTGVPRWGGEKP